MAPDISGIDVADLPSFEMPAVAEEANIRDQDLPGELRDHPNEEITFELVDAATKRGKHRLVDSRGYSYTKASSSDSGMHQHVTKSKNK